MNKRRSFLLSTLLICLALVFIESLYLLKYGWRLSLGIDYLIYTTGLAYTFGLFQMVFGICGISFVVVGVPLALAAIAGGFITFLLSKANNKLSIIAYVVSGIAVLATLCSFLAVVSLEAGVSVYELVMYIIASYDDCFVFYGSHSIPVSEIILNAVRGGLMMAAHSSLLLVMVVPVVTYLFSFIPVREKQVEAK